MGILHQITNVIPAIPAVRRRGPQSVRLAFLIAGAAVGSGTPPYSGTIFVDPDIVTQDDPTTFQSIGDAGQGTRTMYDRRFGWVSVNAYLFNASFSDLPDVEIQVNPEFGDTESARTAAQEYAPVIGRLPKCLREDVQTVWIHKGVYGFGGGNNNLLIHTGQADQYVASGILEETLIHEACHTSLDAEHAGADGWLAAQIADGGYISTYARDNPSREDVAESFLMYYALKYRADRIDQSVATLIERTIPNRIAYFGTLDLGLSDSDSDDSRDSSWDTAMDLGDGWKGLAWFGAYYEGVTTQWIHHLDLGWTYRHGDTTDSVWFWRDGLGWLWTSQTVFPNLYRHASSSWIYWHEGGGSPYYYYDQATGSWVLLGG